MLSHCNTLFKKSHGKIINVSSVAADEQVVDYVRHTSRPFIFSTSITPASVACARASLVILRREPLRMQALKEISEFMRQQLINRGVKIIDAQTPIIPIYTYNDLKTFKACVMLAERGVYVNPVVSPAVPEGVSMLRTSYTATHTKEQMIFAAKQIAAVLTELEVI